MSLIWLHGSARIAALFNTLLYAGLAIAGAFVLSILIRKLLDIIRK